MTQEREPLILLAHSEAPSVLPYGWRELQPLDETVQVYQRTDFLTVLFSASLERDGKRWLHVSASRPGHLPSWDDLREVKSVFIGDDRLAVQVLPRQKDYINVNPDVLHLWCCLDADPVPDFVTEGMI